jgi:hypothetical protein
MFDVAATAPPLYRVSATGAANAPRISRRRADAGVSHPARCSNCGFGLSGFIPSTSSALEQYRSLTQSKVANNDHITSNPT